MSAIISECGQYRYLLQQPSEVDHPDRATALFVMLNPSTADAELDDPTIRRCRGFARDWGCAGLNVANLYAYRATKPADLWTAAHPEGPLNDYYLASLARDHKDFVCAWGANARPERVYAVSEILKASGARLWCLGTTKSGAPRHPLYVRADQPLIPWEEN